MRSPEKDEPWFLGLANRVTRRSALGKLAFGAASMVAASMAFVGLDAPAALGQVACNSCSGGCLACLSCTPSCTSPDGSCSVANGSCCCTCSSYCDNSVFCNPAYFYAVTVACDGCAAPTGSCSCYSC